MDAGRFRNSSPKTDDASPRPLGAGPVSVVACLVPAGVVALYELALEQARATTAPTLYDRAQVTCLN